MNAEVYYEALVDNANRVDRGSTRQKCDSLHNVGRFWFTHGFGPGNNDEHSYPSCMLGRKARLVYGSSQMDCLRLCGNKQKLQHISY